jgi:hypothetical protein
MKPMVFGASFFGCEHPLMRAFDLVYGFLTAEANAVVAPIHPKAMPAILTTDGRRSKNGTLHDADFADRRPRGHTRSSQCSSIFVRFTLRWRDAPRHGGFFLARS